MGIALGAPARWARRSHEVQQSDPRPPRPPGLHPGLRWRPHRRACRHWRAAEVRALVLLPLDPLGLEDRWVVLRHPRTVDPRPVRGPHRRAARRLRCPGGPGTDLGEAGPTGPTHPSVVVAERAIRDEGTSYHYLPAGEECLADRGLVDALWSDPAFPTGAAPSRSCPQSGPAASP